MYKFFRYSGNKANAIYIQEVNDLLKNDNSKIFIEPFCGSAGITFNLNKEYDKYVFNDIDRNIIRIYKSFKEIDYDYYIKKIQQVFKQFGKFISDSRFSSKETNEQSKQSYYKFRKWFNENHWKTESIDEGIYIHMLANSCINSFLRFGKNGMNQGYGLRFYYLDLKNFNHIKYILKKSEFYNKSYKEIFKKYPNAMYFLDPPYFSQKSSYSGFNENEFKEFLSLIKNKNYIYTDIENEYNKSLKNKVFIREMNNTAPSSKKEKRGDLEFMYTSLHIIEKPSIFF